MTCIASHMHYQKENNIKILLFCYNEYDYCLVVSPGKALMHNISLCANSGDTSLSQNFSQSAVKWECYASCDSVTIACEILCSVDSTRMRKK